MNDKQKALIDLLERKRENDLTELNELLAEHGEDNMVSQQDFDYVHANISGAIQHVKGSSDPFKIGYRGNDLVFPHRDWVGAIFSTMANDHVWLSQFKESCDQAFWDESSDPVCLSEYAK